MTLPLYLIDTHALFWREFAPTKLPKTVRHVFDDADAGRAQLILHPVVMAEFFYVLCKEGYEKDAPTYLQYVKDVSGYRLEPLIWDDVLQLPSYSEIPEMHDRLIALAANRLGATLVTKDKTIQASPQVKWLW